MRFNFRAAGAALLGMIIAFVILSTLAAIGIVVQRHFHWPEETAPAIAISLVIVVMLIIVGFCED